MLAFNQLGSLGRLGNQMFEYSALRGIAERHGYEWRIPPFHVEGIENYSLQQAFKLESVEEDNLEIVDHYQYVSERFFHFDQELFEHCPDNVSLHGFFQSEKYFKNVEHKIRQDYTFHDSHLEPCREIMEEYKDQEPIMLHVRRGDPNLTDPRGFKWSYTQCSSQHPPQTLDYYERALAEFDDNQPVFVCDSNSSMVLDCWMG